jgi:type IV pilus assembly protein PilW
MNKRAFDNRGAIVRHDAGMTLIELMVALAIGSFLMIGAVTVFTQSRTTFRVNESVSRLQENARFVFDTVEPDVRMAHYWGLSTRSSRIQGRATQLQPASPPAVAGDCNTNWTIDLTSDIEGGNNGYTWVCAPYMGAASPTADTLVVRRASESAVTGALDPNRLYIQSARVVAGQLFQGGPAPTLTGASETHALVVNGYYVSPTSTLSTPGNQIPSLRMKTLISGGAGPQIVDQEVLPGVEDMQVQFGVDTDNPGAANRGSVDRYVNPDDPILDPASPSFLPDAEILAVRLWFRLRAERTENGFTDTTNYVYADQNVAAPNDSFRRIVVSKTIYLRNARPPS